MHQRVGVGDIPLVIGNLNTDALIQQGIRAGVQWASQQPVIQQVGNSINTALQGATIGGAIGTAIFPGIGTAVGTVAGALLSFVQQILTGIGQHTCTFTFPNGQPIACQNYGRNIVQAIDWLRTHPIDAITMHPSSLAQQFNIVEDDSLRKIWNEFVRVGATNGLMINPDDLLAIKAAAEMPSARDLLRIAQVPAASSWIAAQPQLVPVLPQTLSTQFPALVSDDITKIWTSTEPLYKEYAKTHPDATALGMPDGAPSRAKKIVTGVAVTAAVGTVATYVYARMTHRTFLQVVKSWVPSPLRGRRRNPLPSALGPTTGGRTLAYRVPLGGDETIAIGADGLATYYRGAQPIALFRPTTYQLPKIRSGSGEVLIFTHQVLRTLIA